MADLQRFGENFQPFNMNAARTRRGAVTAQRNQNALSSNTVARIPQANELADINLDQARQDLVSDRATSGDENINWMAMSTDSLLENPSTYGAWVQAGMRRGAIPKGFNEPYDEAGIRQLNLDAKTARGTLGRLGNQNIPSPVRVAEEYARYPRTSTVPGQVSQESFDRSRRAEASIDFREIALPDGRTMFVRILPDGTMVDSSGNVISSAIRGQGQPQPQQGDTQPSPRQRIPGLGTSQSPEAKARVEAQVRADVTTASEDRRRGEGRQSMTTNLTDLAGAYLRLQELGAIVDPDRGTLFNIGASSRSSTVGQAVGSATGSEAQSIRQRISNLRPLLVQTIRQVTGMSARGMDSNRELEFYLQAATDTRRDILSNLAAIQVLDQTFGLGNVLKDTLPPELFARVSTQASSDISRRPIVINQDQLGVPEGTVEEGYRFLGGDPGNQSNWERVTQ